MMRTAWILTIIALAIIVGCATPREVAMDTERSTTDRRDAIDKLARQGGYEAIDTLIELLKDETYHELVRVRLTPEKPTMDIRTGEGGERTTVRIYTVREEASNALRRTTGQDFGKDYDAWKRWWEENKDKFK